MESPNNEGERIRESGHILSPNEASIAASIFLHLIELMVKGVPWNSPKEPKMLSRHFVGCFLQTDAKASVLKTAEVVPT